MDLLVFGKLAIGGDDGLLCLVTAAAEEQDRDRLSTGRSQQRDHRGGLDTGLGVEGFFEVFGVDIDAGRRDDDLTLAANKAELALLVALREIAGGQPLGFVWAKTSLLPGGA